MQISLLIVLQNWDDPWKKIEKTHQWHWRVGKTAWHSDGHIAGCLRHDSCKRVIDGRQKIDAQLVFGGCNKKMSGIPDISEVWGVLLVAHSALTTSVAEPAPAPIKSRLSTSVAEPAWDVPSPAANSSSGSRQKSSSGSRQKRHLRLLTLTF